MELYLFIILAAVLLFGYTEVLRRIRLNILRDRIFDLRHRLVLLPYNNEQFKHGDHVYISVEIYLNIMIRYAHRMSFSMGMLFVLLNRLTMPGIRIEHTYRKVMDKAINQIQDAELKKALIQLRLDIDMAAFEYLNWTSPLFLVYVKLLQLKVLLANKTKPQKERYFKAKLDPILRRFEYEAEALESQFPAAA